MAAPLREGLSFCLIAGEAVFLDLSTDRYFRLTPQQNADFLALMAQATVSSIDLHAICLSQLTNIRQSMVGWNPARGSCLNGHLLLNRAEVSR